MGGGRRCKKVGSEVNRQRQGARVAPPLSAAPTPRAPGRQRGGGPGPGPRTGRPLAGTKHRRRKSSGAPCPALWSTGRTKPSGGGCVADATLHWQVVVACWICCWRALRCRLTFFSFHLVRCLSLQVVLRSGTGKLVWGRPLTLTRAPLTCQGTERGAILIDADTPIAGGGI